MPRISETFGRKWPNQIRRKQRSTANLRNSPSRLSDSVAQTIPEDVLDDILSWVHDQKSLKSCTTVCRSWYAPSARALLRDVTIVGRYPRIWSRQEPALKSFNMQLKASPIMATMLTKLVITGLTDFSLLREVISQLKALHCLSFLGMSFLYVKQEEFRLACVKPFAHIDHIIIGQSDGSEGSVYVLEDLMLPPYVFDALGWFTNIGKLDLVGPVWNRLQPMTQTPPQTRVHNLSLFRVGQSGDLLRALTLALAQVVILESAKTVIDLSFQPGLTSHLHHYTSDYGNSLRDCTLRFNLSNSRDSNYVRYAPDMSTWDGATDFRPFIFSAAPHLQRLCLSFLVAVDDHHPHRMRAFADTWRYCMAGLATSAPIGVLHLHFKIVVSSPEGALLLFDAIQWSCLDTLIGQWSEELTVIKIGFIWSGLVSTEIPRYLQYIESQVSDGTRARLVLLDQLSRMS